MASPAPLISPFPMIYSQQNEACGISHPFYNNDFDADHPFFLKSTITFHQQSTTKVNGQSQRSLSVPQAAGPVREECPFLLPLRCPQNTLSAALANLFDTHPLWPRNRDSTIVVSLKSSVSEQDEVARLGWREVNLPTSKVEGERSIFGIQRAIFLHGVCYRNNPSLHHCITIGPHRI